MLLVRSPDVCKAGTRCLQGWDPMTARLGHNDCLPVSVDDNDGGCCRKTMAVNSGHAFHTPHFNPTEVTLPGIMFQTD